MALSEATLVAYGRRTVLDRVGSKADLELWTALNDAVDMLAEDYKWPFFLRKGAFSIQAPYSTGTIAISAAGTNVTLTTGTWPTWAASGNLLIAGKIYSIATRTSGTVVVLDNAWGDDAITASSYVIYQDEYALSDNMLSFGRVFPGNTWGWGGEPVGIEELWERQNAAQFSQQYPGCFAISNGNLVLWPYPSDNSTLAYSYYAKPTALTGTGSGSLDWPVAKLQLLHRAYDYHLALRFGDTVVGDAKKCYEMYQIRLASATKTDQNMNDMPGMMDSDPDFNRFMVPDWKRRTQ